MARNRIYSANAGQTSAVMLLITALVISVAGYFATQMVACSRGHVPNDIQGIIQYCWIALAVLAVYVVGSVIKRRATYRPLPLEGLAATLTLLLSIAWVALHFLSCERMI